jgi:hypothetical protein
MTAQDDHISPVVTLPGGVGQGNLSTSQNLTVASASNPPTLRQDADHECPPIYLGFVPTSPAPRLQGPGLISIDCCILPLLIPSDKLVTETHSNRIVCIWSADLRRFGNHEYLVLPNSLNGEHASWAQDEDAEYPSNKMLARKSYARAFSIFYSTRQESSRCADAMALVGTSGIGKSFFNNYAIWRLLHPDGVEVTALPRTILYKDSPKEFGADLYHDGRF